MGIPHHCSLSYDLDYTQNFLTSIYLVYLWYASRVSLGSLMILGLVLRQGGSLGEWQNHRIWPYTQMKNDVGLSLRIFEML